MAGSLQQRHWEEGCKLKTQVFCQMLGAHKEMATAGRKDSQLFSLPGNSCVVCGVFPSQSLTLRDTTDALKSWCRTVVSYFSTKSGSHLAQCLSFCLPPIPSRGLCSGEAQRSTPHAQPLMSQKMKPSAPPMYLAPLAQCLLSRTSLPVKPGTL